MSSLLLNVPRPATFYGASLRQALLERKKGNKAEKGKGKFTEAEVQAMAEVD